MEMKSLMETVAYLSYILGQSGATSGDSRVDIQEVMDWAENFEELHKETDWNTIDYISEIEKYSTQKIDAFCSLHES